jgi:uncharacterized protein YegP (UPF0339 family)
LDENCFIHGLPESISRTINEAFLINPYLSLEETGRFADFTDEEKKFSSIKQSCLTALDYIKKNDALPNVNFYFQYGNGTIIAVEGV